MEEERKAIYELVNLAWGFGKDKITFANFNELIKQILGEGIEFTYDAQEDVWEFKNNEER